MHAMMNARALAVGLLMGLLAIEALAHGDVTPHPVDTSSLQPLGKEWVEANPYRGSAKAVAVGAEGYAHNCAGCHGLNAQSGGVAPDLLALAKDCVDMAAKEQQSACLKDSDDYFKDITLHGKKNGEGRFTMPAYGNVFTQEAVWAVKAYIDSRTFEASGKKAN